MTFLGTWEYFSPALQRSRKGKVCARETTSVMLPRSARAFRTPFLLSPFLRLGFRSQGLTRHYASSAPWARKPTMTWSGMLGGGAPRRTGMLAGPNVPKTKTMTSWRTSLTASFACAFLGFAPFHLLKKSARNTADTNGNQHGRSPVSTVQAAFIWSCELVRDGCRC